MNLQHPVYKTGALPLSYTGMVSLVAGEPLSEAHPAVGVRVVVVVFMMVLDAGVGFEPTSSRL